MLPLAYNRIKPRPKSQQSLHRKRGLQSVLLNICDHTLTHLLWLSDLESHNKGKTEHYYVYFLSILSVLLFLIAQLHLTYYFVQ